MRAQMSEAQYAQELECSFEAAVIGTYYAKQISLMEAGRIDGKPGGPQIGIVRHDPDSQFPLPLILDILTPRRGGSGNTGRTASRSLITKSTTAKPSRSISNS